MKPVIHVENVSKQYRLGLTRTSLSTILARTLLERFRHAKPAQKSQVSGNNMLWALKDISFQLNRGDSLALIGKNGAGKSTILKLLAKITRPSLGNIAVNGRLSALIELGSGFHPDLTGRENVYLNGTILGLKRNEIDKNFDEIVAFSELDQFIDTPIKRYSSGMLVRLGFAVASCLKPDILLVDEVLAVGDATFRQKCLSRIESMLAEGTSILFVSHNLFMAQAVCQNALYIDRGRMKAYGQTTKVIEAYESDLRIERLKNLELSETTQAEGVTDVRITRIDVLGENGLTPETFKKDDTVEIRVSYAASSSAGISNAAVRVINADGVSCCVLRTKYDGHQFTLNLGEGSISVFLQPLQLTAGTYYIEARINNASNTVVLASSLSDWFHVSAEEGVIVEADDGFFVPNRWWQDRTL